MRHYEIVFLAYADHSAKVPALVEKYRQWISNSQGAVHRLEDWGRRQLAYPIAKQNKAHYILMNIECSQACLEQLRQDLRYNENVVMRHLILAMDEAVTETSPILKGSKHFEEDQRFDKEETPDEL